MIIVKQSKTLLNKVTPDILTGQRSPSPSPSSLEPPSPKSNNVSRRSTVSHHNHHTASVNGAHSPPNSPNTHKGINYAGGGNYFADHDISPVSSLDPDADLENTDNVKHLKDTLRRGRSGKHHGHNNGHSHAHGHNRQHRGTHKEDRDDAQNEGKEVGATTSTGAVSREKRTGSSTLQEISPFEWILICIIILLLIIVYKL